MLPLHRQLEECAFRALPALLTERHDGWVVRLSGGGPRRANSVNVLEVSREPLLDKVTYCENLFAAQGVEATFRLTSHNVDPGLDALLEQRGYARQDESIVMARALDTELDQAGAMELSSAEWLALLHVIDQGSTERKLKHAMLLERLALRVIHGAIEHDGKVVGLGLAVLDEHHAGLFDIVTLPEARRQGYARRLTLALMEGARQRGAQQAYLQVVAANHAARNLYGQLGFEECYRYWYRVRT